MKNLLKITLFFAFVGFVLTSCKKADEVVRSDKNELGDIYATMESFGSSRLFEPRYSANMDTIYFDIPYFYPVNSDNEVDLKKIILRSTVPADASVSPVLGTIMDVTKPFSIDVISGTGVRKSFVVVAKKVGDLSISSAKIKLESNGITQELEAIIKGSDIIFYVLPGTDISNVTFNLGINNHSTSSIANGTSVNLSQNVPVTITGIDGSKKTYTLKAEEPVKLAYGVGINRRLWTKGAGELGFTNNNETGIAISGDHLVVVTRTNPARYRVFNRLTGDYIQDLPVPFAGISMQIAEDAVGNLIGTTYAAKNAKFLVYKWKNATDPNPVKLIDWTNNNPAGITGDGGVGRRVNIYGNLDDDAVITTTAGVSTIIYKWIVKDGQLVNNTPEVMNYKTLATGATSLGFYSEAQPISTEPNSNYFLNYQFELALVNGNTHERITGFANETNVYGIFHMPTAYTTFNNANYLAIVKYIDTYSLNKVQMSLFDVTETSKMSLSAADPRYPTFNIYSSEAMSGTVNGNGTADICIGFSPDKERMQVYMLLTNGGIMAHEFTKYTP